MPFRGFSSASNIIKSSLMTEPGVLLSELSVFGSWAMPRMLSPSCVPRTKAITHNIHNSYKKLEEIWRFFKDLDCTHQLQSITIEEFVCVLPMQMQRSSHIRCWQTSTSSTGLNMIECIDSNACSVAPCSWNRDSKKLTSTVLLWNSLETNKLLMLRLLCDLPKQEVNRS